MNYEVKIVCKYKIEALKGIIPHIDEQDVNIRILQKGKCFKIEDNIKPSFYDSIKSEMQEHSQVEKGSIGNWSMGGEASDNLKNHNMYSSRCVAKNCTIPKIKEEIIDLVEPTKGEYELIFSTKGKEHRTTFFVGSATQVMLKY